MRLGIVVVMLAAIAVAHVHLQRRGVDARHELQRLRVERVGIRRCLWDQEVRLSWETAPDRVRRRAERMPLGLVDKADLNPATVRGAR